MEGPQGDEMPVTHDEPSAPSHVPRARGEDANVLTAIRDAYAMHPIPVINPTLWYEWKAQEAESDDLTLSSDEDDTRSCAIDYDALESGGVDALCTYLGFLAYLCVANLRTCERRSGRTLSMFHG